MPIINSPALPVRSIISSAPDQITFVLKAPFVLPLFVSVITIQQVAAGAPAGVITQGLPPSAGNVALQLDATAFAHPSLFVGKKNVTVVLRYDVLTLVPAGISCAGGGVVVSPGV